MNDRQQLIAGTDAETMTSAQRLDEIAGILAGAMLRLRVKRAAGGEEREFSRDSHLEVPRKIGPYAIGPE